MCAPARFATNSFISEVSVQGITLNRQQMLALPRKVQESAVDTLARLSSDPHIKKIIPLSAIKKPLSLRLEEGRLYFTPVGEKNRFTQSVRALDYPQALLTISQLQSAARVRLPETQPNSPPFAYPVRETRPKEGPEFFGLEATEVLGDANGFLGATLEMAGRGAKLLPTLNSIGGNLHVLSSLQKVQKHAKAGRIAKKCSDKEGVVKASLLGGAASVGLLGSASKAAFGTTMSWCSLGANAMLSASALYSLRYLPTFRKRFHEITNRQDIPLQKKAELSILFLQQQIALTEADQQKIALRYQSPEKRSSVMDRKLEKKWDRFVRRVGTDCAHKVATESGELLEEVRRGSLDGVMELWRMVDHNISSRVTTQLLILALSLLGIALSLVGIVAGGSLSSSVVFAMSALGALSAALWLLVDSSHVRKWVHL